jgi:hypothetical protein
LALKNSWRSIPDGRCQSIGSVEVEERLKEIKVDPENHGDLTNSGGIDAQRT